MSEFTEQKELIRWWRDTYPQYAKCVRLSLNGINLPPGKKAAMMINQMKSQGMVLAESDLFFGVPNLTYHGLYVEMKDFGKVATPEQEEYLEVQRSMGYEAVVLEGAEAAKEFIQEYMKTSFVVIN
ncbi:MAG: hypothetical protein COA78_25245 [Blastopirellula sp.]|nr:MAG: hypothetical protein COA78_25245 [Blastopirellula sp.]